MKQLETLMKTFANDSGRGPLLRRSSLLLLLLLLLLAGAGGYWWYASATSALSGQIVSSGSHGQPVPGAEISVVGTARSVRSDSQGRFLLKLLPAVAIASAGVASTWGGNNDGGWVGTWVNSTSNSCFFGTNLTNTACVNPLLNGTTQIADGQAVMDTVNFSVPFNAGGCLPKTPTRWLVAWITT